MAHTVYHTVWRDKSLVVRCSPPLELDLTRQLLEPSYQLIEARFLGLHDPR